MNDPKTPEEPMPTFEAIMELMEEIDRDLDSRYDPDEDK